MTTDWHDEMKFTPKLSTKRNADRLLVEIERNESITCEFSYDSNGLFLNDELW